MGLFSRLFSKSKDVNLEKLDEELKQGVKDNKQTENQNDSIQEEKNMTNKNVLDNMLTKTKRPVNTSGKSVVENVLNPKHLLPTVPIQDPKHKGKTVAEKIIKKPSTPIEEIESKEIESMVSEQNTEIPQTPMPVDTTSPDAAIKEVKTGFLKGLFSPTKKEQIHKDEQPADLSSSDELESEKRKITSELDNLTKDIESMIKDMESKIPAPSKATPITKKPAVRKTRKVAKAKPVKKTKTKKTSAKKQASKKTPKKTVKTKKKTK